MADMKPRVGAVRVTEGVKQADVIPRTTITHGTPRSGRIKAPIDSAITIRKADGSVQVVDAESFTTRRIVQIDNQSHDKRPWKLTTDDVLAIRDAHAAGVKQAELAKRYDVTPGYISALVTGRALRTHHLRAAA